MAGNKDKIYLECKTGSSNKFYTVYLERSKSGWDVMTNWGRIGTTGQFQVKQRFEDRKSAVTLQKKLIRQKLQKGYKDITVHKAAEKEKVERQQKKSNPLLDRFLNILE